MNPESGYPIERVFLCPSSFPPKAEIAVVSQENKIGLISVRVSGNDSFKAAPVETPDTQADSPGNASLMGAVLNLNKPRLKIQWETVCANCGKIIIRKFSIDKWR